MIPFKVKKLKPEAKLPSYAHPQDAGMDLYAPKAFDLKAGERNTMDLGFAAEFPAGYMVELRDKSGLASLHGIHVLGGIIDAGYRGEWRITLLNTGAKDYHIETGEKIAQAVVTKIDQADIKEVDELSFHIRGEGGHGSTGKF